MPASKMAAAALVRAPAAGQLPAVSAAQSQLCMLDHRNYTVAEGAPVSDILKGMLGPLCDDNHDAFHRLKLRLQELEDMGTLPGRRRGISRTRTFRINFSMSPGFVTIFFFYFVWY
jgi:hypothetical protein